MRFCITLLSCLLKICLRTLRFLLCKRRLLRLLYIVNYSRNDFIDSNQPWLCKNLSHASYFFAKVPNIWSFRQYYKILRSISFRINASLHLINQDRKIRIQLDDYNCFLFVNESVNR